MGRYRNGIELIVDVENLAAVIYDLRESMDIDVILSRRGTDLNVRPARDGNGGYYKDRFVIVLDKYQRAHIEGQMTVQAWADKYGGSVSG